MKEEKPTEEHFELFIDDLMDNNGAMGEGKEDSPSISFLEAGTVINVSSKDLDLLGNFEVSPHLIHLSKKGEIPVHVRFVSSLGKYQQETLQDDIALFVHLTNRSKCKTYK